MTIVDIHCHTFNADDLPVHGFIQRVAFKDHDFTDNVAAVIDLVTQGNAPGFTDESRRLDELLTPPERAPRSRLLATAAEAAPAPEDLEDEVDRQLRRLQQSQPELIERAAADMVRAERTSQGGAEELAPRGLGDLVGNARRLVRWALLFAKLRVDNTAQLLRTFDDRVDLATPLLVDLGLGLQDTAKTTMQQQVELGEKISRVSMLGRLPGGPKGHVHPFVGFDPRRQLRSERAGDPIGALGVVRRAVTDLGFVGVKMYPPMGFAPLGNAEEGIDDGARIDEVLRELYGWCVGEDVPITVHANPSNFADPAFEDFSSPERWELVLEAFPELRLNLGHFGGAREDEDPDGWPWRIARLTAGFPNLYADVGNHRIDDDDLSEAYVSMLAEMFDDGATSEMAKRLMWGTDWYMLALHPDHEDFLEDYEEAYRRRFGDERTADFLGRNALRFLGFDDPVNKNARRVRARYEAVGAATPAWLA